MIFLNEIYPRPVAEMILDRTKTQTRRLVKDGEKLWCDSVTFFEFKGPKDSFENEHTCSKMRTKWQVGRDYAVQLGRGKKGLWYCPKCKGISSTSVGVCLCPEDDVPDMLPHRFKIIDIRKEHLCNISEEDAIAEGTGSGDSLRTASQKYIETFITKVAWNKVPTKLKKRFGKEKAFCIATRWNPKVWVLKW